MTSAITHFPCAFKAVNYFFIYHTILTLALQARHVRILVDDTQSQHTVKSQLSERRLSETTGLFEDDGQSRLFSLLSIAIKLPIIRVSIIRKIQFYEVISRSQLKKMLLNYPSRFEVQMSRMVIMISLFGRVQLTHLSDLEKKVETGN